jgi:predicted nucleic acid-binding protein
MGKVHFIDTSAILKLLVKESGSETLHSIVESGPPLYTSQLCVAEALGVLKTKHFYRKELSQQGYYSSAYYLTSLLRSRNLIVKSLSLINQQVFFEAEDLGKKHGIDLADALQLATLMNYPFEAMLITADSGLTKAARAEGFEVWNCVKEPTPQID